jgi:hypothetical protein
MRGVNIFAVKLVLATRLTVKINIIKTAIFGQALSPLQLIANRGKTETERNTQRRLPIRLVF